MVGASILHVVRSLLCLRWWWCSGGGACGGGGGGGGSWLWVGSFLA